MSLLETVYKAIRQNHLISPDTTIVVAVSGGADSLTLLHVLNRLRERLRCTLHAATLDHGLRGESSAEDVRFVVEVCGQWGIPVTTGYADARQLAEQQGIGTEAAARSARYEFLASVARQVGTTRIAVAHHADDQAETVLMHLVRGTGLPGLRGMAFQSSVPQHPDLILIRPLLAVTRAQIETYCAEQGLLPREDVTNRDTRYLRNYLRWEILPRLKTVNPAIQRTLIQLGDVATVEDDYMRQEVAREVLPVVDVEDGRVSIGRKAFRAWHPALQRRAILWAVGQIGSVEDVTYLNVVAAAGVGLRGRVGAVAELSGAMRLRVDYDALVIELNTTTLPESDILLNDAPVIPVVAPGVTKIPGRNWQLCVEAEPSERSQARLVIPDGSTLLLRTRRAGDRFAPLGLGGHTQRLSEWMVDHKVPRHLRPRVPLLVINGEIAVILYGVQWTIGQHFAVGDDATPVCFIRTDGCIV